MTKFVKITYDYTNRDAKICAVIGIRNLLDTINISTTDEFIPLSHSQRYDILASCLRCEMGE